MSGRGMLGTRAGVAFLGVALGVAVIACDEDSNPVGVGDSMGPTDEDAGLEEGNAEASGGCGNGRVDTFDDGLGHYGVEGCDDGNQRAGDGCSASCTVEDGFVCNDERPQVCTSSTPSPATGGAGGSTADNSGSGGGAGTGGGSAGLGGEASIANGGGSAGQGGNGLGGNGAGATSNGGTGGSTIPAGGQGGGSGGGGSGGAGSGGAGSGRGGVNAMGNGGVGGAGLGGSESQSGGAGGDGTMQQSGGAGGDGPSPEGCPNDDLYTLPLDATLLITAECNAFDAEGAWFCMDDGVQPSGCVGATPIFREGEGVCLSGSTTSDPTFAAWGADLGVGLKGLNGLAAPFDATAHGILGFRIAITGNAGGQPLRLAFASADTESVAPFVEVPGAGTYDVFFDDAIVPEAWGVPESGSKPDASALTAIYVQIVGGDQFANYDFCIESMRALGDNVPEP